MKSTYNGGLELAILNVIEKDRQLTQKEAETKRFLESLPKSRMEFSIGDTDYYLDRDKAILYFNTKDSLKLKQVPGNPIVIQRSMRNAGGGWIHLNIYGQPEWDLHCDRKNEFFFIKGAPY